MKIDFKKEFAKINKNSVFEKSKETQKIVDENWSFCYSEISDIINDLYDEINELKEELSLKNNSERVASEFGDVLFVLCNLAKKFDIDVEKSLDNSTNEFQRRILYIENKIGNKNFKDFDKEEQVALWKEAKKK